MKNIKCDLFFDYILFCTVLVHNTKSTIEIIKNNEEIQSRWKLSQKDFNYAKISVGMK